MSIEKDLQQTKPFANEIQKAAVNLMFTSRFVEAKLQAYYKELGLTMKQYNILRILKGAGKPISTQLIRERMIDRMSDISRIVDRMVKKEIVTKVVNNGDKRLVDISLTSKGEELLNKSNMKIDVVDGFMGLLNDHEAVLLNELLDKIRGYE